MEITTTLNDKNKVHGLSSTQQLKGARETVRSWDDFICTRVKAENHDIGNYPRINVSNTKDRISQIEMCIMMLRWD